MKNWNWHWIKLLLLNINKSQHLHLNNVHEDLATVNFAVCLNPVYNLLILVNLQKQQQQSFAKYSILTPDTRKQAQTSLESL